MRILSTGLTVAALIALGACNKGPNTPPADVGSMALPSTGAPGVTVREPTTRDVGSMTAPSGTGGVVSRTSGAPRTPDTGSMALPPAAQGNSKP
jgi:hypothetical protein